MKQILINNDIDTNIIINIESNTTLPGSYINAEYKSNDFKILELENLVEYLTKDRSNTTEPKILPSNFITNTKIISTYDQVIEHFKESPNKYFVTGVTDSKFNLISKFFNKKDLIKNNPDRIKLLKYASNNNYEKVVIDEPLDKVIRDRLLPQATLVENNLIKEDVELGTLSLNTNNIIQNNIPLSIPKLDNNNLIRTNIPLPIPGLDTTAMILNETNTGYYEYILYLNTENPVKYIDLPEGFTIFTYMRSHIETEPTGNIVAYDGIIDEPKIISEVFIDRGINSAFEKIKKLKNVKSLEELNKLGLNYYKINTNGYNFRNINN